MLIEYISNSIPFANRKGKGEIERIIQLLPLMQKDLHLPYEMERWAAEAKLTPNYFCSLFKKVTKMTPLAYITKCRIQSSKHLLLSNPSMPINKISSASGYSNASYFNKIFMEMEGITLSEFRKFIQPNKPSGFRKSVLGRLQTRDRSDTRPLIQLLI